MEAWIQKALEYGLAGLMLYWFSMRAEKRLKNVEISLDRSARASSLLTVALDVSGVITDQARDIITKIDAKRREEDSP